MNSILIRISAPFVIIILALLAFENGVVVEYKPELGSQSVGMLVFHIISLFTFGAKDYGPPVAGPIFWQYVLYFVYYAAPVICLSALAETIYLLSKPLLPLLLYRKKHYLIIGYGRVGKAAASYLRETDPNCRIVVLDNNPHQTPGGVNLFRWKLLFLHRDMNDPKALDGLRLDNCQEIYLLTDQEWLNLKLFYAIKEKTKDRSLPSFVRVSSIDLISYLEQKKETLLSSGSEEDRKPLSTDYFFNVHMAACHQLFDEDHINDMLRKEYHQFRSWIDSSVDSLIFFGFGRFGSAFLHEILCYTRTSKESLKIIIVDPRAEEAWKRFQIDHPYYSLTNAHLIKSGMEDMALLEKAFSAIDHGHSVALFGSNIDTQNIRYATAFHKMYDRKEEIRYIIRANTKNNFPEKLLENFLGTNFILIPTYDWVKAFFEDTHQNKKSQG